MKHKTKCMHYEGDGYTYQMFNCELFICKECEKCLRENILEQIKAEELLK